MLIGFDGSRAFIKNRTGTENYSYQLLKALSNIDHENKYIVYLRSQGVSLRDWPKNFTFKIIKWIRFWTQAGLAIQTFKDNLDVLFIPAHTSPLVHKKGLKTVVTVHDLGVEYLPKYHQLKQQLYLKYITRYQLSSATKLIAVSKATKDDLIKKGIDGKKIEVIYEGYDRENFKPQMSNVKSDRLINSLTPYYVFVGTIQPRKNLERIIEAFAIHLRGVNKVKSGLHLGGGAKLVIAGSKGWLSDDIYELPKLLGIDDRVKFLGFVPDKDMRALYSGAEALLFPSLFEGFGLPILEAQAYGCPVITSNTSSMPEIAGKGAVFVNPYSVEDIIRGMERVKANAERVKLIKAGFENVKKFSWEKCAKETLRVLEQVTSNK